MKKLLLLLATVAATAGTGFAQAPTTPPTPAQAGAQKSPDQMVERRVQYLTKELSLTADQQAKLTPILVAQRQEMQTLRSQVQTGGRRIGMAQDLKAAQARYDTQIKAVLTPEQYTKFTQMKEEQKDKLRERRASGQGMQAPE
jgi:Spy/CpxP family protein refolding chaperone